MPRTRMHHKAEGKKFEYARMLRQESTEAETKLWQHLRGSKLGVKFRRQHPIEGFVVDFISIRKRLIVEVDGGIHEDWEVREKDHERQRLLESYGYRFVRFRNEEIMKDISSVVKKIKNIVQ